MFKWFTLQAEQRLDQPTATIETSDNIKRYCTGAVEDAERTLADARARARLELDAAKELWEDDYSILQQVRAILIAQHAGNIAYAVAGLADARETEARLKARLDKEGK